MIKIEEHKEICVESMDIHPFPLAVGIPARIAKSRK